MRELVRRDRAERGATLVELMVVLAVMGVVAAIAGSIILSTREAERFNDATGEAMNQARVAGDRIQRELREASEADCDEHEPEREELRFCPGLDEAACDDETTWTEYRLDGEMLVREADGEARIVASSMRSFTCDAARFEGDETPSLIDLRLELLGQRGGRERDLTVDLEVRMRNAR